MYCNSFAQTKPSTIQGKVLIENNQPADAATAVLLAAADSSVLKSNMVNKNGQFEFQGLQPDSYLVLISKIGYVKVYAGPYKVTAGQKITANDIVLKLSDNQLKEVKVVARKPYIEVKPGKIVLSVQNSILAEGNSAFDILRQSPGVRVNSNETLSINGRQAALITIDGKPTNLTGDDLTSLLRSMQSSTIDQVEMISSPSAKYDASGGGIINIILKRVKT
ncbi:carboxypeptidase regulatory-like domain-containing protein [Mucilaginibacter sp. P25]|uniref:carboxypeptidase-like regulatory domain-containing protein n=1 Tax=unclassified Mucilaginibacter TaxID=2617802 RepID=UPI003D66E66D